jgi:hypothetical protein
LPQQAYNEQKGQSQVQIKDCKKPVIAKINLNQILTKQVLKNAMCPKKDNKKNTRHDLQKEQED